MDECICTECGKIRHDKIFGYVDDPCRCDHSEEDYMKNKEDK